MLTIAKSRDLDYYEREVIEGRAEYLSEDGRSPGRWAGSLAAADGFTGIADRDELAEFFAGRHPSGDPLTVSRTRDRPDSTSPSRRRSRSRSSGPSAAKTTPATSRRHSTPPEPKSSATSRRPPARSAEARPAHLTEPGTGFLGAVFIHKTSRLGDPGIHLHWTVFNVAEGPDGRRTALHASPALRRALHRRGHLPGHPPPRTRHPTRPRVRRDGPPRRRRGRRHQRRHAHRLLPAPQPRSSPRWTASALHSGDAARVANLNTRKAKETGITEAELRAEWRQRAADHRFDLDAMPRVPRTPTLAGRQRRTRPRPHRRTRRLRTTRRHPRRGQGRPPGRHPRHDPRTHRPVPRQRAGHRPRRRPLDHPRDAGARTVDPRPRRPTRRRPPPSRRRRHPSSAPSDDRRSPTSSAPCSTISAASGRPVDVVVGRAGAGKTFALDAVRDAFEASGHRVRGISLAARAARELEVRRRHPIDHRPRTPQPTRVRPHPVPAGRRPRHRRGRHARHPACSPPWSTPPSEPTPR